MMKSNQFAGALPSVHIVELESAGVVGSIGAMATTHKGEKPTATTRGLPQGHCGGGPLSLWTKSLRRAKGGQNGSERIRTENSAATSKFKRRVSKAAWRWMGAQTLPLAHAGCQPFLGWQMRRSPPLPQAHNIRQLDQLLGITARPSDPIRSVPIPRGLGGQPPTVA